MGRFLAISIALHALIFVVHQVPRARVATRATLEIEVRERERVEKLATTSATSSGGRGTRTRGGSARTSSRTAMAELPSSNQTSTTTVERGGAIELFPPGVIQKFGAAAPAEKHGRRDEEGPSEAQVVGERVRGWLEDAAGGERARTLVAPEWRDFERRLVDEFRPPRKIVEEKLTAGTWARQLVEAQPRSEPLHPSREERAWTLEGNASSVLDQMAAARAAYREPRKWWRVEVEVSINAAGNLTTRIARSSGKRALDRHALGAVERAAAGKLEVGAVTRWSCEAAIAVDPVPKPVLGFSFDESLGKIKAEHPIPLPEVQTRVTLMAISRRE